MPSRPVPANALFSGFPPPVPPAVPQPTETGIHIRKYQSRRNRGFDWESLASLVGTVVLLGVGGLLVGVFVNQSMYDLVIGRKKARVQPVVQPDRLQVPLGGGQASKRSPQAPVQAERQRPPAAQQVMLQAGAADEHLRASVASARIGAFDEADLSAEKALAARPGDERAEGMRLVIAYVQQYQELADEALASLNHNDTEIDLGGRNGKAAFVERDGDILTLRVRGTNKKFDTNTINGMPGARFRITRDFLDRNGSPVNHLILGARIFITQQDERGKVDPVVSRGLADARWRRAAISDDATSVEHANLMLKALDIK